MYNFFSLNILAMKRASIHFKLRSWSYVLCLFLLSGYAVNAQVASLPLNEPVPYVNPKSPEITHVDNPLLSTFWHNNASSMGNAYNSDLGDYAVLAAPVLGLVDQKMTIDIGESVVASQSNPYFVGFDILNIDGLSIGLGNATFEIKLFNGDNTTPVATYDVNKDKLLGLLGLGLLTGTGNPARIGFTLAPSTPVTFTRAMIVVNEHSLLSIGGTRVYNLVLGKYAPANYTTLPCNLNVTIGAPNYPVQFTDRTSNRGVINPMGALDSSSDTFTELGGLNATLQGPISYAVGDVFGNSFNTTNNSMFVGFDIENAQLLGLLDLNLLQNFSIQLYNNGSPVGTARTGTSLLSLGLRVVGESGRTTIGFITADEFDEVELKLNQLLSATTTKVHGVVVKKFCTSTLACNTITTATNPDHPLYINLKRTTTAGLVNVSSITNPDNIINGSSDPATVVAIANVGSALSVSVANALETYPAGSYAGYIVESSSLLNASLIASAGIKLEFYNRSSATPDNPVYETPGAVLAGVGVISGSHTEVLGAICPVPFDEVRLVLVRSLLSVDLGGTKIHGFKVQKSCAEDVDCLTEGTLTSQYHGAVVNGANTGVRIGAQVGLLDEPLEHLDRVVDNHPNNYASMNAVVGVVSRSSLSVASTSLTFPKGSFAGFEVSKDGGLLDLGLLGDNNIRIVTFKDGVAVDSADVVNGSLISLGLLSSGSGRSVIGFHSKGAFDEIQIRLLRVVAIETGFSLNIYGAVASARYGYDPGNEVYCAADLIRPDQNTGFINTEIPGNTSTNDELPAGATYSAAGSPTVPPGANFTFNINANGSYTFITDKEGTYTFPIKVCIDAWEGDCPVQNLTIYVLNRTVTNPPIAFHDFVKVPEGGSNFEIDVKLNDIPGNVDGTLGNPFIGANPTKGSATVSNGKIYYTPNAGSVGRDFLIYTICESPSGLCSSPVYVLIDIIPTGGSNSTIANDDQILMGVNSAGTGNVLANDYDPENHAQTVLLIDLNGDGIPETAPIGSPQTVLYDGQIRGTITMNATTGDFTFVPANNFKGSISCVIEIGDELGATSKSTLVLIVKDTPDLLPVQTFGSNGANFNGIEERDFIIRIWEMLGGTALADEKQIVIQITKSSAFEITVPGLVLTSSPQTGFNGVASLGNSNPSYSNGSWEFYETPFAIRIVSKSGYSLNPASSATLGFHIKRRPGFARAAQNITYTVAPYSGGETKIDNNYAFSQVILN